MTNATIMTNLITRRRETDPCSRNSRNDPATHDRIDNAHP